MAVILKNELFLHVLDGRNTSNHCKNLGDNDSSVNCPCQIEVTETGMPFDFIHYHDS